MSFDNIDHEKLIELLELRIDDKAFIRLIRKWLKAGILEPDGAVNYPEKGSPQGGIVSPLIANIVLNHLDWCLEAHGFKFVRYADDFLVFCKSKRQAEKALEIVTEIIEGDLGLRLSPEKTHIATFGSGFNFLGF